MNSKALAGPTAAVLAGVIVALATTPTIADAAEGRWQLRLAALTMDSGASAVEVIGGGEGISIWTNIGGGLGVDIEYQLSRRLGVDLGVLAATPHIGSRIDFAWWGLSVGTGITVTPITAGLNVHLTPDSRFDLYLGPLLAYVIYESFAVRIGPGVSESFTTGNDFGFGANLGLDIHLGSGGHWSLVALLKYIDTRLEATPADGDTGVTEFDPTIFGIGVAYRF